MAVIKDSKGKIITTSSISSTLATKMAAAILDNLKHRVGLGDDIRKISDIILISMQKDIADIIISIGDKSE